MPESCLSSGQLTSCPFPEGAIPLLDERVCRHGQNVGDLGEDGTVILHGHIIHQGSKEVEDDSGQPHNITH